LQVDRKAAAQQQFLNLNFLFGSRGWPSAQARSLHRCIIAWSRDPKLQARWPAGISNLGITSLGPIEVVLVTFQQFKPVENRIRIPALS